MFEAIHGSAPRRAGQNLANPSGLFLGAVQMLVHIGQGDVAEKVHNAWLTTIEDGIHTYDIFEEGVSTKKVGTSEFADAVIERIGRRPEVLKAVTYPATDEPITIRVSETVPAVKEQVGIDVFLHWNAGTPDELGAAIEGLATDGLKLVMISNRGQKVYPGGVPETFCTDHWRCRFMSATDGGTVSTADAISLLGRMHDAGFDFIKTEGLYTFDGKPGYTLGQGQ